MAFRTETFCVGVGQQFMVARKDYQDVTNMRSKRLADEIDRDIEMGIKLVKFLITRKQATRFPFPVPPCMMNAVHQGSMFCTFD